MTDAPGTIERQAQELRRLQQRATEPLWRRLRAAEIRAAMRSTVSAMDYSEARVSHGKLEDVIPASAPQDTGSGTLKQLLEPVEDAIKGLERALDLDMGHAAARNYTLLDTDDKDLAIVNEWRGVHSREVARTAPELGSQRTIEKVRKDAGLRPVDGTEIRAKAA